VLRSFQRLHQPRCTSDARLEKRNCFFNEEGEDRRRKGGEGEAERRGKRKGGRHGSGERVRKTGKGKEGGKER
jgi:hypothetical protein